MAYLLSRYAERDITQILTYTIETWGIKQFKKYRDLIEESLHLLGTDPQISISRKRDELFLGCRSYLFGKHIIFYRVQHSNVEIVRILHQRMDVISHIPEEYLVQ